MREIRTHVQFWSTTFLHVEVGNNSQFPLLSAATAANCLLTSSCSLPKGKVLVLEGCSQAGPLFSLRCPSMPGKCSCFSSTSLFFPQAGSHSYSVCLYKISLIVSGQCKQNSQPRLPVHPKSHHAFHRKLRVAQQASRTWLALPGWPLQGKHGRGAHSVCVSQIGLVEGTVSQCRTCLSHTSHNTSLLC